MFTLQLRGIKEFQKALANEDFAARFAPEFGYLISSFHNQLNKEVQQRYNTNRRLDSVLVGGLTARSVNKRLISGEIKYWSKALPLAEFATLGATVTPSGYFLATKGKYAFQKFIERQKPVNEINVTIRRGQTRVVRGRMGRGAYFVANKKHLAMRKQDRTFTTLPSEANPQGVRAPSDILFTLGLAGMAENVFNDFEKQNGGSLQKEFDKMHERLADAAVAAWRG